jgi:para-aminobenzoate synthetase component 1
MYTKLQHPSFTAQSLPWTDPLALAGGIMDPYWVLLYSGVQAGYSGRYSYLAWNLAERVESQDFSAFEQRLAYTGQPFDPAWFGYMGYGLKDCLETLTPEQPNWITLPKLFMMRFHALCVFDHEIKTVTLWSDVIHPVVPAASETPAFTPAVTRLTSNMTQAEYLKNVQHLVDRIHAGDLYQANLTRKFIGEWDSTPDGFSLFRKLCNVSPAPYSVYMQMDDTAILSSSPERFLTIDANGQVTARPIKGTAARNHNPAQDHSSRDALISSSKDRAENLMIVDLMRNDLSRACLPGSVETKTLFEVTTHPTVHHMSSTVIGKKKPELTALDVVKCCFPPGSMTGAPKIRAMNVCAELEGHARGVYSGAIGWFGGDGSCDLSVVIRTLIIKRNRFEFQVGGGIVADSTPALEMAETFHKARGILLALGLPHTHMETI